MTKTLVIWWRFGKEHGEENFRVNPPGVIAAHLDQKVAAFRATPDALWRWWQVEDGLIVECPGPDAYGFGADTRVYYLVERGLAVIGNIHFPELRDTYRWYIHLADIFYDSVRACWIKKDLFCDIVVEPDGRHHRLFDLGDLGEALKIGLVSPAQVSDILRRTDSFLKRIADGAFPFPEVLRGQGISRKLYP
ncbi:MAG: hypothetical protein A3F84_04485 [Candidatus Handelsmanbacteria bacterium RIFCSPLOWO2_12_FULL_64_10]|uniref:DUF402 domain-containing protein n=1 Tax=Handelsmanbacteria sp. (strain RIFCSPLOWO2_12_FULL_64_10) TaxID=1817868 RepID=A0A1F6D1Z7_HANXR|nr:MAG: hypothetical protein A3F84_04485 [Candidatus Handelsmanbacteria bacterium RIFCSPLOWO2_12_FULL_64_10]